MVEAMQGTVQSSPNATVDAKHLKVLVKEKISDEGVKLLQQHFDVEVNKDMTDAELKERINDYDALIIRSATKVTADILEDATRLKIIGRAGVGVDNVDVPAATKKGIIVCNAPGSNSLSVAEHALALLMAQARMVTSADASMKAGRWEKSKFKGVELDGKVLGILGMGKIGQLVAPRAKALGMTCIAYDPYVTPERFRELGVERADSPDDLYAQADFITVHLPKRPETAAFVDDAAFAKMKKGVRIINCARGGIVDEASLARALDSGQVASAGLDVFSSEPVPADFPLLGYENVVMTPHLGASTSEAQDRAGVITAQQVMNGLLGRFVSTAVNIPPVDEDTMEALGPFLPLAETLGSLIVSIADGPLERFTVRYEGGLAEIDTRLLTIAVQKGVLERRCEEAVNYVNAPSIAEERGYGFAEEKEPVARDYTNLITVISEDARGELTTGGTVLGPQNKPRLVKIYRHDIDIEPSEHMAFFRYEDVPGMIGKVGTALGDRGINIAFMNVGRKKVEGKAVMALALDHPISQDLLDSLCGTAGISEARAVEL